MYKKVMLVDDDEISLFLTEASLLSERFALKYECFPCGRAALQALLPLLREQRSHELPEVILLDLNMPLISGWDFLVELLPYADQLQAYCRIYILSSSVDEREVARAEQNDLVTGFLQKPLMPEQITQLQQPQ